MKSRGLVFVLSFFCRITYTMRYSAGVGKKHQKPTPLFGHSNSLSYCLLLSRISNTARLRILLYCSFECENKILWKARIFKSNVDVLSLSNSWTELGRIKYKSGLYCTVNQIKTILNWIIIYVSWNNIRMLYLLEWAGLFVLQWTAEIRAEIFLVSRI